MDVPLTDSLASVALPHRPEAPVEPLRPRLILLHGLLSSRRAWDPLRHALGMDIETLAPDLPGYGNNRSSQGGMTSLEAAVESLLPLLTHKRPTVLVGHSLGAIVALGLAARCPQAVANVGVIGLPVFSSRKDGIDFLGRRGLLMRALLMHDAVTHAGCRFAYPSRSLWLPVAARFWPRQPEGVLGSALDHDHTGHGGALNRVIFADLVAGVVHRVASRVAVLHGTADRAAPLERVQDLARLHGWCMDVRQDATHQIAVEQPEVVAAWLRARLLPGGPSDPAIPSRDRIIGTAKGPGD